MNIQDEMQKIHHKYGVSEMANYKTELLFNELKKELLIQYNNYLYFKYDRTQFDEDDVNDFLQSNHLSKWIKGFNFMRYFEIKNRFDDRVIHSGEFESLKDCVVDAIKNKIILNCCEIQKQGFQDFSKWLNRLYHKK